MFDIGWSEMAVVLLVALIVIGPRDLPRVARTMGKWVAKGRAMAREFQSALEDMAREAELDKVKSEIEKAGRTNLGKTIENTIDPTGELGQAFDPTAKSRSRPKDGPSAQAGPEPAAPATPAAEPVPSGAPAAEPVGPGNAGAGNGEAADHRPEPRATTNGSGRESPERETARVEPS